MRQSALSLAACCVAFLGAPAFAAQDGTAGQTSAGSFGVDLTIQPPPPLTVQISGLQDIALNATAGSDIVSSSVPICIYHSSAFFSLTVQQPGRTDFALVSTTGLRPVPLRVRIDGVAVNGSGNLINFSDSITVNSLSTAATDASCSNGTGQTLTASADVLGREPGSYSAVIQLILAIQ